MLLRFQTGLLAAALMIGCVSDPAPVDSQSARIRWSSSEPAGYHYEVYRSCFCPGPHDVYIRANRDSVLRAEIRDPGSPDSGKVVAHPQSYSIDSLFAQAEAAQKGGHHSLNVHFDAHFGFPDTIAVDMVDAPLDGGVETVVSHFTVDTDLRILSP